MKKTALALAITLGAASGSASALTLYPHTGLEDDDLDFFSLDANLNGRLDVGDQLTAIVEYGTVFQLPAGPGVETTPSFGELTGITTIEVETLTQTAGTDTPGNTADDQYTIKFKPAASFEATYGTGAMLALFLDPTPDLTIVPALCTSLADCTAKATDGDSWATLGLDDPDDEWLSVDANINVTQVAGLPSGTKIGALNFGLSFLTNNTGYTIDKSAIDLGCGALFTCAGDGKVDFLGSGDLSGGAELMNGAVARSDTDGEFKTVPEPATLGLLGLGLLGMAGLRRRKNV